MQIGKSISENSQNMFRKKKIYNHVIITIMKEKVSKFTYAKLSHYLTMLMNGRVCIKNTK